MTAFEEALAYTGKNGWPVFPCTPGKIPLVKDWGTAASTDPEQLTAWWRRWPDALIGLPCGRRAGFIVFDIDIKNGRSGLDTLAELDVGLTILPETPIAHTRSGGLHVYFACHPSIEIRNSVGARGLGPNLDVRGEGGLVVLPSVNSGYSWDPIYNFDTIALQPAPYWLGHRIRPPEKQVEIKSGRAFKPEAALRQSCDRIRCARDGEKHDILNREAFRVGTLVAANLLRQNDAWNDLQAATATLIASSTADRQRTWKFLHGAFNDGLRAPRRAER